MHVILEVIEGPGTGKKVSLQDGQTVTVGRTEKADRSFPQNSELSSVHFSVSCQRSVCRVRDLRSANGIEVNGVRTDEADLRDGDRLKAGQAVFRVVLVQPEQGHVQVITPVLSGAVDVARPAGQQDEGKGSLRPEKDPRILASTVIDLPLARPRRFVSERAVDVPLGKEQLDGEANSLLTQEPSTAEFIELLMDKNLPIDALRFLACALEKPVAILWACDCLRQSQPETLDEANVQALDSAVAWARQPGESQRRAAEKAAKGLAFRTPASWIATAAFWSGGTIGPADAAEVPVDPLLFAKALAGGLLLAASHDPAKMSARFQQFIRQGIAIGQPV